MSKTDSLPIKTERGARQKKLAKDVVVPVSTWRYNVIFILFGCLFIALGARAVQLQVVDNDYLQSQGDARYLRVQNEPPTRGMITDRNGQPLAVSTPVDSIWMHPATILRQQKEYPYKKLTSLLGTTPVKLLDKAEKRKGREFVYLKRHLSPLLSCWPGFGSCAGIYQYR
jgi:cell division protein FtsI (penicillin-binding protein 3)